MRTLPTSLPVKFGPPFCALIRNHINADTSDDDDYEDDCSVLYNCWHTITFNYPIHCYLLNVLIEMSVKVLIHKLRASAHTATSTLVLSFRSTASQSEVIRAIVSGCSQCCGPRVVHDPAVQNLHAHPSTLGIRVAGVLQDV